MVHASMFVAILLIAAQYPMIVAIAHALDATVMTLLRFVFAVLILTPYIVIAHRPALPSRRELFEYLLISFTLCGFFVGAFASLRYTSALNTGALHTTVPGLSALCAIYLVHQRPPRNQILALFVGMFGALWVIFRGELQRVLALDVNVGDLMFFGGCCALALYVPLIQRFYRGQSMVVLLFWVLCWSAIIMFIICIPDLGTVAWREIDLVVWIYLVCIGFFPTVVSNVIIQSGAVLIGTTRAVAYMYMTPSLVLFVDWMMGKGLPDFRTIVGVLIVLTAIVVLQRKDPVA